MSAGQPPDGAPAAAVRRTEPHGLDPVDICIAGYLAASGAVILAVDPGTGGFVPLAVRLALAVVLWVLRRHPLPTGRGWELARRAYPLAVFPYLYAELSSLNVLVTTQRFDTIVIHWEETLFGSQPSLVLREWLPWRPLSEYLHLGYFSYYFAGTFAVLAIWRRGLMTAVSETVTAVTLTYVVCYVFFILFPVVGPYHTYIPPDPETLGWVFPPLTHAIVRAGSSPGTAFPSSHVAVAVTVSIQTWRYDPRARWLLVAFVPALVVGTVYGGFHYAVDAIAGGLVAVLMNPVARRLFQVLETRRRRITAERILVDDQRAPLARRS